MMTLQDIYVYPIKSLGGVRLNTAKVEIKGLEHDRRWLLIDDDAVFITQRKFHHMALLQVELKQNSLKVTHRNKPQEALEIGYKETLGESIDVVIWEDTVKAELVSPDADAWFSDMLGMSCRLVVMPKETQRKLKPKYTVNDEYVSFADGMPYMVIGQASLDDLNTRLEEKVNMNRFRPNFVFSGATPFEEDSWGTVEIGACTFKVTKPCSRCVLITVNPETAEKGKEPLKTLASYRTFDKKVNFGQNMIALQYGQVSVGDVVVKL